MKRGTPGVAALFAVLLLFSSGLVGCKESTLGPESFGNLEGQVLASSTNEPVAGASVTTSPPTDALVADAEGRFVLEDLDTGSYAITANHPDFQSNTVTVSVRGDRTAQSTIFLTREDSMSTPSLEVDITNFSTRTTADSAFVRVEYRARNTSSVRIPTYEVYFRIETENDTFLEETRGDSLAAGQADVGQFERYTLGQEAQSVTVDDVFVES